MFYWKHKVFSPPILIPVKQADSQWEWITFHFRLMNNTIFYAAYNQAVECNSAIYHCGK